MKGLMQQFNPEFRSFEKTLTWVAMNYPEEPDVIQLKMAKGIHKCVTEFFDDILPKIVGQVSKQVEFQTKVNLLSMNNSARLN